MNLSMHLKDYLGAHYGEEGKSVSMERLLSPFGIYFQGDKDDKLLLGLVLDELKNEHGEEAVIDPIDVAASALALGYEEAGLFLDEAPLLIIQAARAQKTTRGCPLIFKSEKVH